MDHKIKELAEIARVSSRGLRALLDMADLIGDAEAVDQYIAERKHAQAAADDRLEQAKKELEGAVAAKEIAETAAKVMMDKAKKDRTELLQRAEAAVAVKKAQGSADVEAAISELRQKLEDQKNMLYAVNEELNAKRTELDEVSAKLEKAQKAVQKMLGGVNG